MPSNPDGDINHKENGLFFYERIRNKFDQVPFILHTGNDIPHIDQIQRDENFFLVTKPESIVPISQIIDSKLYTKN